MRSEQTLEGEPAVVTGGSRGIGRSVALELAARGAKVAVAARSRDDLEAVAETIRDRGGEAIAVPTDVTDGDDVTELFERTRERFGRVDLLVNNAGIATNDTLWDTSEEEWRGVIDVNLNGTYRCTRAALDGGMVERGEGTIVNVSSLAGKIGFERNTPYVASKHGIQGMTNALAKELKETDIRVSAVCPGQVATELTDDVVEVDRLEPDDVADLVGFLATCPPEMYVPEIVAVPAESIPLVSH